MNCFIMMPNEKSEILNFAKESIAMQIQHLADLKTCIGDNLTDAVDILLNCKGRVVLCGIGKSAIIAQKIAATFNSTGTASLFLHAAEAVHGDLGMVQPQDVVLMISNSGNSPEIKALLPLLLDFNVKIIGIGSNSNSDLSSKSHCFLHTPLKQEADPNNLAPTCSTTMQLVIGDALAVCLIKLRKFNSSDFAKFHPGGSLGKKLYLTLSDVLGNNAKPSVATNANIEEVLNSITKNKLGATVVMDGKKVCGIITDGDIRRYFLEKKNAIAIDFASPNPLSFDLDTSAYDAFQEMEKKQVGQIVITQNGEYIGLVHLHQILKAGIF